MKTGWNISLKGAYMNAARNENAMAEIERLEAQMAARQHTGQDVSAHMYRIAALQDSLQFEARSKAKNTK